jgi:hypothetical protein
MCPTNSPRFALGLSVTWKAVSSNSNLNVTSTLDHLSFIRISGTLKTNLPISIMRLLSVLFSAHAFAGSKRVNVPRTISSLASVLPVRTLLCFLYAILLVIGLNPMTFDTVT